MQKITITGANSYLGSFISKYLLENSDNELLLIHSQRADEDFFIKNAKVINFKADLSLPLEAKLEERLKKTDKIFHFAWLRGINEKEVFVKNKIMLENLLECVQNPQKLFFISSVSGTPNTKSQYGANKYKALTFLQEKGANCLILGLVIEEKPKKGPYKMLLKIAEKLPIAFRLGKKETLVFPLQKENLGKAILNLTSSDENAATYGIFETPEGFNVFMQKIEQKKLRKRIKLKLSTSFLLTMASFAKKSKVVPVKICDQILTFFYKDSDFLLQNNIVKLSDILAEKFPK